MAFSTEEWEQMTLVKEKYTDLSIRKLKDKIQEELGIDVSVKSIHNRLFQNKSTQKNTQSGKSTQSQELIIDKGIDGRNKYNKQELIRNIERLHIQGQSRTQISNILNIPEDTVNYYLHKDRTKNEQGLTRSQQLKEEMVKTAREKAKELIEKIVDDRIEDYDRNREFEKGLIETKKAELKILMNKIRNMSSGESEITEDHLKELNHLVSQINKLTSNHTRETVSMLKDLGFTDSENKIIHTNIENAERMVVIDDFMKGVLEDDE